MRKTQAHILTLASLFLAVLLPFQNCSFTGEGLQSTKPESNKPANNGEGYTGKPLVNIDVAGTCGTVGGVKAQIEKSGSRYIQTVKECSAQPPEDVTDKVNAMEHNLDALLSGASLFERLGTGQSAYSEVVCRGEDPSTQNGTRAFADVSMQPTNEFITAPNGDLGQVYLGYVKLGTYSTAGVLEMTHEFPIKRAVKRHQMGGHVTYFIESPTNGQLVNGAVVHESYFLVVKPDNTALFHFKTKSMTQILMIDVMTCATHSK